MVRKAFARLALRLARWKTVGRAPTSGILVGAPHTSSWDWVAMLLLTWRDGVQARVLIKRELFRGPLAVLLRVTGGIPLDRRNPGETIRTLLAEAAVTEQFLLVLAAEGTREAGEFWKSCFYKIAQQTGLPITLGFIDGPSRTMGFGPTFTPTGDIVADMDGVRAFYADKYGIHPELRTEPRLREESSDPR
jgi:1-acyl-sn-glycerol-3-phosphate acyltransferase